MGVLSSLLRLHLVAGCWIFGVTVILTVALLTAPYLFSLVGIDAQITAAIDYDWWAERWSAVPYPTGLQVSVVLRCPTGLRLFMDLKIPRRWRFEWDGQ